MVGDGHNAFRTGNIQNLQAFTKLLRFVGPAVLMGSSSSGIVTFLEITIRAGFFKLLSPFLGKYCRTFLRLSANPNPPVLPLLPWLFDAGTLRLLESTCGAHSLHRHRCDYEWGPRLHDRN